MQNNTYHALLSSTPTSMFRGLSWDAMHRLADRRRPVGHCAAQARQCDACRGAAHLALALIVWEALDELRGVPRSMGAAAAARQSPRLSHTTFAPRACLLRGGGWRRLSSLTHTRSERCVRTVDYSAPALASDPIAAQVAIVSRRGMS